MKNLLIVCFAFITSLSIAQDFTGNWNGVLEVQGTQLRLVFNISEADGDFICTMDSPDQGAKDIPTSSTIVEGQKITIELANMQIKYEGELSEDGSAINGTFNQGPMSLPLSLSREKQEIKIKPRPQDPQKMEYTQEEVRFENEVNKISLAGTLTIPKDGKFTKAVILISGSGPQNRNEEISVFNHRPFLVLSHFLTNNGIAVLRYDDRGVGESEGNFGTATSADFADDAEAAFHYLKSREDMQKVKIGFLGHSEGGMIAPMVASRNKDVDFIGLLAGPGIPINELMLLQSKAVAASSGATDETIAKNLEISSAIFDFLKETSFKDEELKKSLSEFIKGELENESEEFLSTLGDQETFISNQVNSLTTPWFLYFIKFNPADYLSKIKCPVLALNGSLDVQVLAKENLEGIGNTLKKSGNKNMVIEELVGQNHLFQSAKTGAVSEYKEIEETFNVSTMKFISDWILKL
jgi:pimeloyl-ACP methyl ester carboxylesterase